MATCLRHFYGDAASPRSENHRVFIGLRNKIEYPSLPALDHRIFWECQAMPLNFEDMLLYLFGPEKSPTESLSLAIQFSHLRDPNQAEAVRLLHAAVASDISNYIDSFRSSLSVEIRNDLAYSYRVYRIPKVVNHEDSSDLAVEFVKYDPENHEAKKQYNKVVAIVKPAVTQVAKHEGLKAGDVCRAVEPIVQDLVGPTTKFSASFHHAAACRFFKVRPLNCGRPD